MHIRLKTQRRIAEVADDGAGLTEALAAVWPDPGGDGILGRGFEGHPGRSVMPSVIPVPGILRSEHILGQLG
jgi:hypothetical protein